MLSGLLERPMALQSPLVLVFVLLILPLACAYLISLLVGLYLALRERREIGHARLMSGEFPGTDRDNSPSTSRLHRT
jgi:hypothetical protein